MSLSDIFASGVELAFNRCLSFDPVTQQRFAELQGKVIALELAGLGLKVFLLPQAEKVAVESDYPAEADVTLHGTPIAFARMGLEEDSADSLFAGDVTLSGDTELGKQFGEILKSMDIDWEEMASKVMGDVLAHKLGEGVRAGLNWGQQTFTSTEQNLSEYLREELQTLPVREQVEQFMTQVDKARNDVDRLEARIKRLTQNNQPSEQ